MEMNKRETKVTWLDVILALLAGTVIVAGILCIAQTIWSGYHFLDDHELFRIEQSANQGQPLLTTVKAWILNDLRVRYRPLDCCEGGFFVCTFVFNSAISKKYKTNKLRFPYDNYVGSTVYTLVSQCKSGKYRTATMFRDSLPDNSAI